MPRKDQSKSGFHGLMWMHMFVCTQMCCENYKETNKPAYTKHTLLRKFEMAIGDCVLVGPRWTPRWPHEPCYQGYHLSCNRLTNKQNPQHSNYCLIFAKDHSHKSQQCTGLIFCNAPFRTEMSAFLSWMVHCGIWDQCTVGFVRLVYYKHSQNDAVSLAAL